eukprot:symbB.v1.2.000542.t1/scaffold19.1/size443072/6
MVTHSQLAGVGRLESLLLQSPPEVSFAKARVCRRVFRDFFFTNQNQRGTELRETKREMKVSLDSRPLGLKCLRMGSVIKFTIGVPESSKGVKFDDMCIPLITKNRPGG